MTLAINGIGISAINMLQILSQDNLKGILNPEIPHTNLCNDTFIPYKVSGNGRQAKRSWGVLSDHWVIYMTGVVITSTTGSLQCSLFSSLHVYVNRVLLTAWLLRCNQVILASFITMLLAVITSKTHTTPIPHPCFSLLALSVSAAFTFL